MKKVYKVFFGCMGLFLLMPFLGQAQAKIVISQVYGGGGNSNATYNYDYVELFNAGTTAQNLSGWSVQYASSTGSTWSVATLSGSIDPGKYYLIQLATGNVNVGAPLPAADATGTLNLSGTNGKVALVNNTNALSGTCPTTNVVDFVGFGSANCSEGNQPTGVLSNTAAAIRKTNGCTDTDNNGADFDVNTPNPRNSQTAANLCTSPTPPSGAGNANPSSLNTGESTLLTVTVSPGTNPASTGLSVTVNLSSIGGNAAQTMYDNGTNGDAVAGDNIFSYSLAVAAGSTTGTFSLPFSVTDGQSRSASGNIGLTILAGIANSNSGLVISQIYGNGSTTGAFRYDYVEIFNRSTETINLSGKSLQYASATGTGNFGANAITALTGNLAPGQYYLVRLAGAASGTDVPAQDASGTNNISAASGKLVIVNSTQGLACNGGSTPCTTEQLGQIIDLVGYGTANFFEGTAAPALSNTTALFRKFGGCQDSDNNSNDFETGIPAPRNSASPFNVCAPKIVISQVYGGGGNSGAVYSNDFIELFNAGNVPQSLTGWSVQYASSTGNFTQVTPLSGIIMPGKYYLVQQAIGSTVTNIPLPTPDATGTIAMAAGAGKVAVASTTTAQGVCSTATDIVDLVGYGTTANCFEGTGAAPQLSNSTAAIRLQNGCRDTDQNGSDFISGTPVPRNSASAANLCQGQFIITTTSLPDAIVLQPYSATIVASFGALPVTFDIIAGELPDGLQLSSSGQITGTPQTTVGSPFTFTVEATDNTGSKVNKVLSISVNPIPVCNTNATIAEVQGAGLTSPLLGSVVTVSGIVTGTKNNGYFIQAANGDVDANPSTSEGLFVFTSSAPPPSVVAGNNVCITGTVFEFVSSSDPGGRSLTQLTGTTFFTTSTGNPLPEPVVLNTTLLTPDGGIDQLEKFESMRVTVPSLTVVAPTQGSTDEVNATASGNGFFYGVITGTARPFREPGIQTPITAPVGAPVTVERWDANPELLGVASSAQPGNTPLDVATGAVVENLTGPLDFLRQYYVINADGTTTPAISNNNREPNTVPTADEDELTVATYNIERFFDNVDAPVIGDPIINGTAYANRLRKASLGIRNVLKLPDVIGMQEVENLSVLQAIANQVNNDEVNAGNSNPQYVAYLVEGNDPGGIDVGFLVKSTRVSVQSVVQYGKDATFTNPTTNNQELTNDRPPLVLQATFLNPTACQAPVPFIVISNHLRSLNGNEDLTDGRVRAKRLAQATFLAELIQGFQQSDPEVKIISLGDYNAFQFNDGYVDIIGTVKGNPVEASKVVLPSPVITDPELTNLIDNVTDGSGYSYIFFGSAQTLDHVLVNNNMLSSLTRFVPVHMNADFPAIFRGNFDRPERISDHDPQIAYFKFTPPPPPNCSITPVLAPGAFTGGEPNQIYLGYGPQSVTLNTTVENGKSFTYSWSPAEGLSCTDCASPVFTPTQAGSYTFTVTVTNENGCSTTCSVTICVLDVRVPGTKGRKVYLCLRPKSRPQDGVTISARVELVEMRLRVNPESRLGDCNTGNCNPIPGRTEFTGTSPKMSYSATDSDDKVLTVEVAPNPSRSSFTLNIRSLDDSPVSLRVMDVSGKVLSSQANIPSNTSIRTGDNLKQGIYFAEVTQNTERVVVKLIKVD